MKRAARVVITTFMAGLAVCLMGLWVVPAEAATKTKPVGDSDTPLRVLRQSAVYNPRSKMVRFKVQFDQAPDFTTVDSAGRPEDQFQYFILGDPDPTLNFPEIFDSVIRVEPSGLARSELIIRNAVPGVSDPEASGWGAVRARVPFHLRGGKLTFSAPLSALSDHSTNGIFNYELLTTNFGATSSDINTTSVVKPCKRHQHQPGQQN